MFQSLSVKTFVLSASSVIAATEDVRTTRLTIPVLVAASMTPSVPLNAGKCRDDFAFIADGSAATESEGGGD